MTKNRALAPGRRLVRVGPGSLLLSWMVLALLGGCAAGRTGATLHHASGPGQLAPASGTPAVLATQEKVPGVEVLFQ
jgi:hypothetical protein